MAFTDLFGASPLQCVACKGVTVALLKRMCSSVNILLSFLVQFYLISSVKYITELIYFILYFPIKQTTRCGYTA